MREYSEIFKWYYDAETTVNIINTKQAGYYIFRQVPLADLFWSGGNLVFVFDKKASKEPYHDWCNHDLGSDFITKK